MIRIPVLYAAKGPPARVRGGVDTTSFLVSRTSPDHTEIVVADLEERRLRPTPSPWLSRLGLRQRWEWTVLGWPDNHEEHAQVDGGFTFTKAGALAEAERVLQEAYGVTMEGAPIEWVEFLT